MKCAGCNNQRRLGKSSKKIDGYTWRCEANKNYETSVRKLFFDKSHMSLANVFHVTGPITP